MQTEIRQLFEARTSVRRYEYDPIPADALEVIYAAIRNSPTSYNGQQYSVIDIADQEVKLKLYEITGQKQVKTCNRFMVFCADYHRIAVLAKAKGIDMPEFSDTLDGFTVGVLDAAITMQSAAIAAQACGLGCCCVGYVRTANPAAVKALLIGDSTAAEGSAARTGIMQQVQENLETALDYQNGYFTARKTSLNSEMTNLSDKITKKEDALEVYRERLTKQFNYMDQMIAQLNSQFSTMQQQLASIGVDMGSS